MTERLPQLAVALAIVLLALLFRLYYQQVTVIDTPVRADAAQYVTIAWNLLHRGTYSLSPPGTETPVPQSYRGPGYPTLLAATIYFGGETGAWYGYTLTAQAILGAATVALIMLLAARFLSHWYVWAVGLLAALWPHSVTLSGYLLTETLFGFTLVLGLYAIVRALESNRLFAYGIAGGVFSVAAIVNPVIMPFPLFAAGLMLRRGFRPVAVFLVCAALLPAAWSVRGHLIDTPPEATSGYRLMENILVGAEPDFDSWYRGAPEGLRARADTHAALALWREDPGAVWASLRQKLSERPAYWLTWYMLQKPVKLWSWNIGQGAGDVYVYPTPISPFERNLAYRIVHALAFGLNTPLLVAAFAGLALVLAMLVRAHPVPPALLLVALTFGYATVVHAILTPDVRYAVPFRAVEIALAMFFIAALIPKVQAWRRAAQARAERQSVSAT